jgi:hypothetical protein|tara:strand:- start:216 stop:392 length:177 start_codon:yes stop_codon:yes gene_type:complete
LRNATAFKTMSSRTTASSAASSSSSPTPIAATGRVRGGPRAGDVLSSFERVAEDYDDF